MYIPDIQVGFLALLPSPEGDPVSFLPARYHCPIHQVRPAHVLTNQCHQLQVGGGRERKGRVGRKG